jgi:hypothetical protein
VDNVLEFQVVTSEVHLTSNYNAFLALNANHFLGGAHNRQSLPKSSIVLGLERWWRGHVWSYYSSVSTSISR